MPLNDAALDIAGEALAAAITHATLHSGAPDGTGSARITAMGSEAITLVSTNGDLALSTPVEFTGGAEGTTVAAVGLWDGPDPGTATWLGFAPRTTGDSEVNAAGTFSINTLTIPASSS